MARDTVAAVDDRDRLARDPAAIREMFSGVAPRYDFLNHLLSLRRDVAWRRRLVAAVAQAPEGPVLDLATGTGDVALALHGRWVAGADFCLDMLVRARPKAARRGRPVGWTAADGLALPFAPGVFAAVTVAFGVRNFVDLDAGLAEVWRVLVPGGLFAVLEFQHPTRRVMAVLSGVWNRLVVVPVGRRLSGDGDAYAYLPASVDTFPDSVALASRLVGAGFEPLQRRELSGGIAALTVARRVEET